MVSSFGWQFVCHHIHILKWLISDFKMFEEAGGLRLHPGALAERSSWLFMRDTCAVTFRVKDLWGILRICIFKVYVVSKDILLPSIIRFLGLQSSRGFLISVENGTFVEGLFPSSVLLSPSPPLPSVLFLRKTNEIQYTSPNQCLQQVLSSQGYHKWSWFLSVSLQIYEPGTLVAGWFTFFILWDMLQKFCKCLIQIYF